MGTVDVVLSGNILPGAELAEATAQFASLTGLSQEQARELISSGRERIVKRGVSATVGQKYLDKLSSIGAEARLRSATVPAPPTGTDPQSVHQAADQFSSSPPPSTGSVAVQAGQTTAAPRPISPYSAPKAETSDRRDRLAGTWRGTAATVPASHGYSRMPGLSSAAEKEPG